MIKIYNENRLTRQPFFKLLVEFLLTNDEVKLRDIHHKFADVKNIDRQIEQFIDTGLILRADKHYLLGFHVFDDSDFPEVDLTKLSNSKLTENIFTAPFFVKSDSTIAQLLDSSSLMQTLSNSTNTVQLHFLSRYDRTTDTLSNYFYKVAENLTLTDLEREIYDIIGDVDPEYALKYMTSFLLKFMNKTLVKTRADIFVKVLEKYGLVEATSEREYHKLIKFDETVKIPEIRFDNAHDFIFAQIHQRAVLENYISVEN